MKIIKDKKDLYLIIILGIFIILLVLVLNKKDNKNEGLSEDKYKIVTNYSNFFTIENCVNRYLNVIKSKNADDLLTLLNDEYKNKHNINKDNIYNYTGEIKNKTTFQAKKMYQDNNKFYVSGYLMEETIDSLKIMDDYYLIIETNKENNIYDVTPYNGEIFKNRGDINE